MFGVIILFILSLSGPGSVSAQGIGFDIDDDLRRELTQRFRPPFQFPTIPVDQVFACGVFNVTANQNSVLWHYLDFRANGSLELGIELNNGSWISGIGSYTALQNIGLIGYGVSLTYTLGNQTYQTSFNLKNLQRTYGLKMIRYFDASGELTENGTTYQIEMYCQAFGHRYNANSSLLRFECPQQNTATGYYLNTFIFDANAPGNAFRQRDHYINGLTNPVIERSDFGIFTRNGTDVTIDFNANPMLSSVG
ncbi:MAG: hypothetical protein HC808_04070, partial [Candidatus Competibacteraceae bacterium]|nr:hypothetical protein [Candidatus Competibacteraceae bacterium]